jgi:hypothetical protein
MEALMVIVTQLHNKGGMSHPMICTNKARHQVPEEEQDPPFLYDQGHGQPVVSGAGRYQQENAAWELSH